MTASKETHTKGGYYLAGSQLAISYNSFIQKIISNCSNNNIRSHDNLSEVIPLQSSIKRPKELFVRAFRYFIKM